LAHRHKVRVIRLGHELGCLILGQYLDSGNGEQNLVLHHLTQLLAARAIAMFDTSPRASRSSSVSGVRCPIVISA
jgi:hypothetical protein